MTTSLICVTDTALKNAVWYITIEKSDRGVM